MSSRWIQAATIMPPTVKVCGYRLLPFCLRHRIALEAIDSPVLKVGSLVSPEDILVACRILSTHRIADVISPFGLSEGYHLARMKISKSIFTKECSKLLSYFNYQSLWPRFWENDKNDRKSSIPWQLSVVACLVRSGHTTEESWTMPEAEAIWLHVTHLRAAGAKLDVVSDSEWKAMEEYKRSQATNQTAN